MSTTPAATSTVTGNALELADVRKVYTLGDGSEIVALDDATLTLASDEIIALVGPSGSGQDHAVLDRRRNPVGDVRVDHRRRRGHLGTQRTPADHVPAGEGRASCSSRSTSCRSSPPARTCSSSTNSGAAPVPLPRARADQLLEELGLADRAKNLPSQLSGGQRQRVAIGRSLMNDPALVLFDEPTSALDTKLGEQVMELIRHEMKSRGTAAIVVTHDERITHYCDRSVHIVDGALRD